MREKLQKLQIKGFIAGILVMALLTPIVAAANPTVTRQITYGVNVVLNGRPMQFEADSRPFVMDGRTFLPVRVIAEAADMTVDFDAYTNTVILGSRTPTYTPMPMPTPPVIAPQQGTMLGRDIQAFRLDRMLERLDRPYPLVATIMGVDYVYGFSTNGSIRLTSSNMASIFYNLGGGYTTLTGYFGPRDDSSSGRRGQFVIFGDGRRLDSFNVTTGDPLRPFTVDVSGVTQLRIDFVPSASNSGFRFAVVDAVLR